ncbi:PLP-dependent transferase [Trametes sanguinea]|nr:PLP-dependent transferase [Trametes sanguinea]
MSLESDQQLAVGSSIPPFTSHAISVSLPTWDDNVEYEEGTKRVVEAMVTGYPRFFIHRSIQKLAGICEQKFGVQGERCMLFPTRKIAEQCREFMIHRSIKAGSPVPVRLVQFTICPDVADPSAPCQELHIVIFPGDQFPLAKQFWQHAGLGISSRRAERCLSLLQEQSGSPDSPPPTNGRPPVKPGNRHYSAKSLGKSPPSSPAPIHARYGGSIAEQSAELLNKDHLNYLEERYGRNMPLESAGAAKRAMRRRIAGVLVRDTPNDWSTAGDKGVALGPSTRGVEGVTEDDVFLYPTGMAAIWSAHQIILTTRPAAKSVCFGFSYTDTVKFPSNPLLRSADLPRLRQLADKYDFLIVVDETLGNFANVEVLPYADIVVSSLSKIFSGDANVMGGSLVLNPKGRHYAALKAHMAAAFEDVYFDEDAVYMERNSRDFRRRIRVIDDNALAVCSLLRARSLADPHSPAHPPAVIRDVFYPKWITPHNYDKCRVRGPDGQPAGGYGGLFSLTFTSLEASKAFFDALPCMKGPSLGTNFTLACPYTILAHYGELDWAAGWGVDRGLVRVSVGMEDKETLLKGFEKALSAAQAAVQQAPTEAL